MGSEMCIRDSSGTIGENIGYGLGEIDHRQIEYAARLSGIHEFISRLPQGYESQVGEEGMLLSGGQRQRLALARALVTRPNLLILDEPTNHLDPSALQAVIDSLQALDMRPTILIISHNMEILRSVERVYSLKDGKILAHGSSAMFTWFEPLAELETV